MGKQQENQPLQTPGLNPTDDKKTEGQTSHLPTSDPNQKDSEKKDDNKDSELETLRKQLEESNKERDELKSKNADLEQTNADQSALLTKKAAEETSSKPENNPINAGVTTATNTPTRKYPVFLKGDKKKQFPITTEGQLDGVIVRQTRMEKLRDRSVEVPADDLNEFAIYSKEEFVRHSEKGGTFDKLKVKYEVLHEPGQTDSIAD
ncbi:hypothetical protein [Tellurirhabdus bombi]|uniref:hypothetical protein n=1 Tax=Tellurirhabdus bombi TaxID=2907205 RepID=UPI001F418503|nr:hypothetical protein [Tellurirhabdus bombi]